MAQRGESRTAQRPSTASATAGPNARDRPAPTPRTEIRGVARGARSLKKSHPVLERSKSDRFAFIDHLVTQHEGFHVAPLCRRHDVTRAGFYAWRRRAASAHTCQDRALTAEIVRVFAQHHQRYGSPRIYRELIRIGWTVSRRRVARLMRAARLRAKAVCGYRAKAGIRARFAQHPNRVWAAHVTRRDQVWVGDITYLRLTNGWRYLAIVLDHHSRRVLAWTLSRRRTARETCRVLARAFERRRPPRGLIFHSDRGTEYMGAAFCAFVARRGLTQSATVRGPSDNARAESFFHSLKAELTRGVAFPTETALRRALAQYVRYYNQRRLHSALGYRSPIAFERRTA
ncbi:MAG TPA: IS3 family transposase [Gemmatimonadaceae bacterium]